MTNTHYSSKLLETAVSEFAKLPGIGNKTALRLVLHLLKQDNDIVTRFGNAIVQLKNEVKQCKKCHNLSDEEVCVICANPARDNSLLCVVENVRDVMAIENTLQFHGLYHVLGGIISPMDGVGPADLTIASLEEKVVSGEVKEVLLALSATLEGDTTNFYIFKKLKNYHVTITTLARGVAFGDELEYTDEVTLGRSIVNRTPFNSSLNQ